MAMCPHCFQEKPAFAEYCPHCTQKVDLGQQMGYAIFSNPVVLGIIVIVFFSWYGAEKGWWPAFWQ
jgi:hypothetical protein